jgi:aminoglycoside phosphotransferase (APT) family kinase protein
MNTKDSLDSEPSEASFIDLPARIREGEELNRERLSEFLKDSIPDLTGELHVQQFPSGNSNLTYALTFGNQKLVLRRPPFGHKAKGAHDMSREYNVLKGLKPHFDYCPRPLVYSEDESIIGCPFYVMERLDGIILRKQLPEGMTLSPSQARKLAENFIGAFVELHSIDYRKAGLANLGKPEGYVRRQVDGWCSRYRAALTDNVPKQEDVMAWLGEKMPAESDRVSILHNDYKFDNLVLDSHDPMKIIGILDWEMSTLGDPLMDLGNVLAYWVEPGDPDYHQLVRTTPSDLEGMLTRKECLELYAQKTGQDIGNFDFYYCFGIFRLAVIAQQIYYRFYQGQTKIERFERFHRGTTAFAKIARQHIENSKL